MMDNRSRLSLFFVVLLAMSSTAFAPAPVFRESASVKLDALQGVWEYVFEARDQDTGRRSTMTQRIEVEGKTWKSRYTTPGVHPDNQTYTILLDSTVNPATLDLKQSLRVNRMVGRAVKAVSVQRIAMKGIVKVQGNTMTFCFFRTPFDPQLDRPKTFTVGPPFLANGPNAEILVLKRVE